MRNLHKNIFLLFFIFFIVIFIKGSADDNLFKKRLKKANRGDYAVFEYNKLYSSISVFEIDNNRIVLEEITIPKETFDKNKSFKDFLQSSKSSVTSWTLYEIDLKDNKITDTYSVSRNCFIDSENQVSIVAKLLDLNLNKLEYKDRKKIGPCPLLGETDRRKLFEPMKYIDGKRIKRAQFDVYRSIWPEDSTELSCKRFDIYFDDEFVFPYFIEVNNGHMSYMIKGVASGKDLKSSLKFFPKRQAEIIKIEKENDNLTISVKNISNYKNILLHVIDKCREEKNIYPIEFEMANEKDKTFLKIALNKFNTIFEKNHKYRFVISSNFSEDLYIESRDILIIK